MLISMSLEAIDPTVTDPITKLFLLPVQNVLQGGKRKKQNILINSLYYIKYKRHRLALLGIGKRFYTFGR